MDLIILELDEIVEPLVSGDSEIEGGTCEGDEVLTTFKAFLYVEWGVHLEFLQGTNSQGGEANALPEAENARAII